mmetsp:Transcript_4681/g.8675  ORF Transcript_4681/g.8675 Transcript_4681/m.8675 type:complete len:124 (+) Transcript_4681:21-392(+)
MVYSIMNIAAERQHQILVNSFFFLSSGKMGDARPVAFALTREETRPGTIESITGLIDRTQRQSTYKRDEEQTNSRQGRLRPRNSSSGLSSVADRKTCGTPCGRMNESSEEEEGRAQGSPTSKK